jgi:hypothetical protein
MTETRMLSATEKTLVVSGAAAIGDRLARDAMLDGDLASWLVPVPSTSRANGKQHSYVPAVGNLYNGTAGIALFLAKLFETTQDPTYRTLSLRALRHAEAFAARLRPQDAGFFTGRVGVAFGLLEASVCTKDEWCFDAAVRILAGVRGFESEIEGADVIRGSAGAAGALLYITRTHGIPCDDMADAFGRALLADAVIEPHGMSWPTTEFARRHLTGLAHGSAGIGSALLDLFAASGQSEYWLAARDAFAYERAFFSPPNQNWPDLRNQEIAQLVVETGRDGLVRLLAQGYEPEPAYPRYSVAWCHGAAGIGLTRLNAWRLSGDRVYRDEALLAVATTLRGLVPVSKVSYSLCHGAFGNCETLRRGARLLGQPAWENAVQSVTLDACDRYGADPGGWPTSDGLPVDDMTLMTGTAGIGLFLLALAANEEIDLLLPARMTATAPPSELSEGGTELLECVTEKLFPNTRRHLGMSGEPFGAVLRRENGLESSPASLAAHVAGVVRQCVGTKSDKDYSVRAALADELFAFRLLSKPADFGQERLEELARRARAPLQIGLGSVVQRRANVRLVWRSEESARGDSNGEARKPSSSDLVPVLLRRAGPAVERRPVHALAAFIVEAADKPTTVAALCDLVYQETGGTPPGDHEEIHNAVMLQVLALHAILALDVLRDPDGASQLGA